jgi:hypothetical protein
MKTIFKILVIYVLMALLVISSFSNDVRIGISFIILAVIFSRTYFLKTFIPCCLIWMNKISNDDSFINHLKSKKTDNYANMLGSFYIKYQYADNPIHQVINKLSWISLLFLPILFLTQFSLQRQVKKISK